MSVLQAPIRRATTQCLHKPPPQSLPLSTRQSSLLRCTATQSTPSQSPPTSRPFSTSNANSRRDPSGSHRKGPRAAYQFRSPKYYRGPLHPHQPPPPNDPASRLFIPGPFTSERLWDHYADTIRSDIMLLNYHHFAPGERPRRYPQRLRKWEGDNPYFAGRPLREPRGSVRLPLVARTMTFRNVPRLQAIVVHAFCNVAIQDPQAVPVASVILQALTGVRGTIHDAKSTVGEWGISKDKPISITCRLEGPSMYRFLASCVEYVMPKIKEYPGVSRRGDGSGNVSFGFGPETVAIFPEVEVNYDMYPPKMIPGIHVTCVTTATCDQDGQMLIGSFGVPFNESTRKK